MDKLVRELCRGRHSTPASEAIFPAEVNPIDTDALYGMAWDSIPEDTTDLVVYVTGLTPAMLAVVKVCADRRISLVAMHYDRVSGEYYPQTILQYTTCGFCGGRMGWQDWTCPHCGAT